MITIGNSITIVVVIFLIILPDFALSSPITNQHVSGYEGLPDSSKSDSTDTKSSYPFFKLNLLPTSVKTAESVNLEHEGIPSKVLTVYDNSQKKLTDFTNAIPIVDTISEKDKYGNNGDLFDGVSRSIVNGYEAFSNIINKIIEKPKEIARSISRGITAQLDVIGGKLVGL